MLRQAWVADAMTPTLLPATLLLLLLLLFPAPCGLTALPIEPALFLNVGSPAAIQAAFMGRPWSGGEVPVVLVYNTSDPCKEGLEPCVFVWFARQMRDTKIVQYL